MTIPNRQTDQPLDHSKSIREWLDVAAKIVIAAVGVVFAYLADDYKQKTSIITLLSQRETAETELRSSMLQNLIGPFVGSATGNEPLEADRAQVLLDLLALNFHTHFELKPLWLKVDADLKNRCDEEEDAQPASDRERGQDCEAQRKALRSVARRVLDRQIQMLIAAKAGDRSWYEFFSPNGPAEARDIDLFFREHRNATADSEGLFPRGVLLAAVEGNDQETDQKRAEEANSFRRPAKFIKGLGGEAVCIVSPNEAYALKLMVTDFDADEYWVEVQSFFSTDARACEKEIEGSDARLWSAADRPFTITPYDLPLTDNSAIDPGQRFALNLFDMHDLDSDTPPVLVIKLVWFPEGYITERERPMNYYQVNETLGLQ